MMSSRILTDREIWSRLTAAPPLIDGLQDPLTQLQPCGVDLTVRTVSRYVSAGVVDFDNSSRELSELEVLPWSDDRVDLVYGAYHVIYNEWVNLPTDVMALAYPRSSLLRCGVALYTAVWDPGYSGRAETLIVVHNARGFRLHINARIAQLVFTSLATAVDIGYRGRFKGENRNS